VDRLLKPSDDEIGWYKQVMALHRVEAVPVLMNVLSDPQQPRSSRRQAALILGLLRDERAIRALVDALHAAERVLRGRAAEALGQFETVPEDVLQSLIQGLQDEDYFVRECCAKTLGQLRRPEALPALTVMSASDEVSTNRELAEKAMEAIQEAM
jgi:hypothetical protein